MSKVKERKNLRAAKDVTYKSIPIKLSADFSTETFGLTYPNIERKITVNQEFGIRQSCPSKNGGDKNSQKTKPALKELWKGVIWVGIKERQLKS